MKKFIYVLFIALVSSVAISGCTEEEITPTQESSGSNGGGGSADPLKG